MYSGVHIAVERIVNAKLNSNTYILKAENQCWLVDPGDISPLVQSIGLACNVQGILITHSHFDHIYGTNNVRELFGKEIPLFCGEQTKSGLLDARLNMSLYDGEPFVVDDLAICVVEQDTRIMLWEGVDAVVHYTPGHNDDCFSFQVQDKLFTGDALIPFIKVHTKSKRANKLIAQQTVDRIISCFDPEVTIYPGHNDACQIKELR